MVTRSRQHCGPAPRLSRRRFLGMGAAGAGAVVLAGCGGDEPMATGDDTTTTTATRGSTLSMSQFIGPETLAAGGPARVPFGVADADGLLPAGRSPGRLQVTVDGPDGVQEVQVQRHDDGVPRGYYPLVFDAAGPGIYTAGASVDGQRIEMSVQVHDSDELSVIRPGQPLPPVATPTGADHRGVEPICTREPPCPLHDVTVEEALQEDRPIALLVATPAFCQIEVCGPVLDVLLDAAPAAGDVRLLHAEVYVDPFNDLQETTEMVQALSLHYEPVLVLADATGTVVDRLDTIFDRREARAALARLGGSS